MYATFPRYDEWLPSIIKEFEVISMTENHVRVFWDCDVKNVIPKEIPPDTYTFNLEKGIVLEGIMTWEELEELRENEFLYLSSLRESIYTEHEENENFDLDDIDRDKVYAHFLLCEELKKEWMNKQVLKALPDIRLRELFKKE